jgi:hypothetical protein
MSDITYDTVTKVTADQHEWLRELIDQVCVVGMGDTPADLDKVVQELGGRKFLPSLDESNVGIEFIRNVVGCTGVFFLPSLLRIIAGEQPNDATELERFAVELEAKYLAEET